jgi:hypothetical protein
MKIDRKIVLDQATLERILARARMRVGIYKWSKEDLEILEALVADVRARQPADLPRAS